MKKILHVFIFLVVSAQLSAMNDSPYFSGKLIPADEDGKALSISMQLFISGGDVTGYYRYGNSRAMIDLKGKIKNEKLELDEFVSGKNIGNHFSGKWDDGFFSGKWTGKTSTYTFELNEGLTREFLELREIKTDTNIVFRKGSNRLAKISFSYDVSSFVVVGPVGSDAGKKLNKNIFESIPDSSAFDYQQMVKYESQQMKTQLDGFLSIFESTIKADTSSPDYKDDYYGGPEWEVYNSRDVLFNMYGIFSYSDVGGGYTGGAHGYSGEMYTTIDLHSGKKLELSDLFIPGFEHKLDSIGERYFRIEAGDSAGVRSLADLGCPGPEFHFPDDFAITKSGIKTNVEDGIYISPYVTFFVPYSEIKKLIKANGPIAWARE